MTASTAAPVPEVDAVPDPVPAPAACSNPLITSTACFDLYPDIDEGPLFRFRSKGIWISRIAIARAERDWRMCAGDILRNLHIAGVPMSDVATIGNPAVIVLGDWGEVRMLQDERGPRVLIRICIPETMGVALSFRRPDLPAFFDAYMTNIVDAYHRAHGLDRPISIHDRPTMWTRRTYTFAQFLSLSPKDAWY